MCLNPIKLSNPKKEVSLNGGMVFDMEVPCGKCAECLERRKSDWYFRCYYEAKSTWDSNGYVYFDTLTYDNEHLPHVNNFLPDEYKVSERLNMSCFDVDDYRKFLVRLRRALSYRGYKPNCLKYFLTSEYGDDDRYTHRPHYHILIFVTDPSLDPFVLSRLINKCWQKGRTDGIDYKPSTYVLNHVFGYQYNCDTVHMQMVCNYVAKYVAKDSDFAKEVEKRLDSIFKRLFGYDFSLDPTGIGRELYANLRKQCCQFVRCSHGFGDDFLKYNNLDDILETGMISMPDRNNVVKHTPLPMYYTRKLFFDLIRESDGAYHWQLNDLGKSYKFDHAKKSVDLLTQRFIDWAKNMYDYNWYHDTSDKEWYDNIIKNFGRLLNGRDIHQFAEYLVFYRGRIKTPQQLDREQNGIYEVDDIETFYKSQFVVDNNKLYYYGTPTDYHVFGCKFFSTSSKGSVEDWRKDGTLDKINRYAKVFKSPKSVKDEVVSVRDFKRRFVINDRCDLRFKDFDKMWSLYCEAQLDKNDWKQDSYDKFLALKKRLKSSGVTVRNI